MKKNKIRIDGGFFICLAINMLLNLEGLIPAAILLGLHFLLGWSVLWSIGAAVLWIIGLIIFMLFMGWACSGSNVPDQSNIRLKPYIVGQTELEKTPESDFENEPGSSFPACQNRCQ